MDHGATFDTGTATHSLVLHRRQRPSRAWVFGAATVQWSWGRTAEVAVVAAPWLESHGRVWLHRKASGCSPHSGGESPRLRSSHREAVAV